jgi:hypothetical protein
MTYRVPERSFWNRILPNASSLIETAVMLAHGSRVCAIHS